MQQLQKISKLMPDLRAIALSANSPDEMRCLTLEYFFGLSEGLKLSSGEISQSITDFLTSMSPAEFRELVEFLYKEFKAGA